MKKDILRICAVGSAFILAEAVLAPALLFGASYSAIAFNAYIALGLCYLFLGGVYARLQRDEHRNDFEQQIASHLRPGRLSRLRAKLVAYLFFILSITCWPAVFLGLHTFRARPSLNRINTMFGASAMASLFPVETSLSLFVSITPAVLTIIAFRHTPPFHYFILFLWLIIGSIFVKHLISLIAGVGVQARLRRGLDPVWVNYGILTVGDVVGLVLAYQAVSNWNTGQIFGFASVQDIFKQLIAFRDFLNFYEKPPDTLLKYCIGISGLLWWLTLAQSLMNVSGYKRTPSDYLSIAGSLTLLGKEARAEAYLESADAKTKEDCAMKGQLYAARGQFDKAATFIKRSLHQALDVSVVDSYVLLVIFEGLLTLNADTDRYRAFIDYGANHGMTDVSLSNLLASYSVTGGDVGAITEHIRQQYPGQFGLTYVYLKWAADEEREVFDVFASSEPKKLNAERAVWLCLSALLWPKCSSPEERIEDFAETWQRSSLSEITTIGTSPMDDIDKCAIVQMLFLVHIYWSSGGSDLNAINSAIAGIVQTLPENEVIANMKSFWPAVAPAVPAAWDKPASTAISSQAVEAIASVNDDEKRL